MTTFIYFLVYVFVAGFFGLFMLVLTAGSLMEQDKRFKALEEKMDARFKALADKIDEDYEALLKKIDKDYEKIIKELQ